MLLSVRRLPYVLDLQLAHKTKAKEASLSSMES